MPKTEKPNAQPHRHWLPRVAGPLVVLAAVAAYANSLDRPFVFDDLPRIARNPAIRTLWPMWVPMATTNRPLGTYTFAINYALGGFRVWGYHAVNLAIHIGAGLLLLGFVRRTLATSPRTERFRTVADGLALTVALLWVLHPLGTAAVTYIVQRLESLMALCYLGTLYGFVQPDEPATGVVVCRGDGRVRLGMGTKEVMATAPLVVLWYDRAFVASGWRAIVRQRWALYVALAGTWGVLAWSMLHWSGDYTVGMIGQVKGLTPLSYLLSQAGVLVHYLRLCVWPWRQCFDYGWPVAHSAREILPPLLAIAALGAATIWAVFRAPGWAFLGGAFFLVLAPSSSIVPVKDLAVEHRMYLPLAAVLVAVVLGTHVGIEWASQRGWLRAASPRLRYALVGLAAVVLGGLTFARNEIFRDELTLWQATLREAPRNERVHCNLGDTHYKRGEVEEAVVCFQAALEIDPDYLEALYNLGTSLNRLRRFEEALPHLRRAIELKEDYSGAYNNLAGALNVLGRFEEARQYYLRALDIDPNFAEANNGFGLALVEHGELLEGSRYLDKAVAAKPDQGHFQNDLGAALFALKQYQLALPHLERAAALLADNPSPHYNLGSVLLALRDFEGAAGQFQAALDCDEQFNLVAFVHAGLAAALAELGHTEDAIGECRAATQLMPDLASAHFRLGQLLARSGSRAEAIREYRRVLELEPGNRAAARELRVASAGRTAAAGQ